MPLFRLVELEIASQDHSDRAGYAVPAVRNDPSTRYHVTPRNVRTLIKFKKTSVNESRSDSASEKCSGVLRTQSHIPENRPEVTTRSY